MKDIETISSRRSPQMEVLVLGLCRTGTMSIKLALEELGYKNVYHFFEISSHPSHANLWILALKNKCSGSPSETHKIAWDEILGGYDAITDIPSACLAPELMAFYQSAKIILTTRSSESWHNSMLRTIHALHSSYLHRFLLLLPFSGKEAKSLSSLLDLIIEYYFHGDVKGRGVEAFERHNEMVRELAKRGNREFLEFRLGDGWESLCTFLDKGVPDVEFPHVNDGEAFREAFGLGRYGMSGVVLGLLGIVAVFVGWWVVKVMVFK